MKKQKQQQQPRQRVRSIGNETVLIGMICLYVLICLLFWITIDLSSPLVVVTKEKSAQSTQQQQQQQQNPLELNADLSSSLSTRLAQQPLFIDPNRTAEIRHPLTQGNNNNNHYFLYTGKFGLGHRLSKLVSAYHLASQPDLCPYVSEFHVQWGTCSDDDTTKNNNRQTNETARPDIFAYLFGSHRLRVVCLNDETSVRPPKNHHRDSSLSQQQSKTVIVRNDVQGYYAGQSYKNARIPVSQTALQSPRHAWQQKMDFDRVFFAKLLQAFAHQHGHALTTFQQEYKWQDHFVIGLHLRAGNGEKDHFVQADRGVANVTEWCLAVVATLQCALSDLVVSGGGRLAAAFPVLVFVSTDTTDVIPLVQAALRDKVDGVVTFPQPRLPTQEGVSYQKWTVGDECFDGWKSAMTDMALLAASNVVVAATRSTFTQILPLSQVLLPRQNDKEKSGYRFCEIGNAGQAMSCFRDRQAWLLRQRGEHTWRSRSSTHEKCNSIKPSSMGAFSNTLEDHDRIVHKVMVHLPDVQEDPLRKDALQFLRGFTEESRFYYGPAFARKYRGGQNSVFTPEWTWASG